MHLSVVSLPVGDVDAWLAYAAETLGLPATAELGVGRVRVGPSVLELRGGDAEPVGPHHLAVTIPTGGFAAAKTWLTGRARLLDRDGRDEFEGPAGWRSRSLYVDGPERSVLELIERRDLAEDRPWTGPFGPQDLRTLSEVGVAVPDVAAAVERLGELGVHPYANPPAESFAALGDVHGLLILVTPGRPWLPTRDREARAVPTHVGTGEGLDLPFPG